MFAFRYASASFAHLSVGGNGLATFYSYVGTFVCCRASQLLRGLAESKGMCSSPS